MRRLHTNMHMRLDQITPGQSGIIRNISGEGLLRRRLLDMGLTPGTIITVRKVAPMGDPMELSLRGYVLTLRRQDGAMIDLDMITSQTCGSCCGCKKGGLLNR